MTSTSTTTSSAKPDAPAQTSDNPVPETAANPADARNDRTTSAEPSALVWRLRPMVNDVAGARKKPASVGRSKTDRVLRMLRKPKGASIAQLMAATGWQAHSVRGLLSGTVRKKLGLPLASEIGKDGQRRYRIGDAKPESAGTEQGR